MTKEEKLKAAESIRDQLNDALEKPMRTELEIETREALLETEEDIYKLKRELKENEK